MLTLLVFEAYIVSRWNRKVSVKYLWSKLRSCFQIKNFTFATAPRTFVKLGLGTVGGIKYEAVGIVPGSKTEGKDLNRDQQLGISGGADDKPTLGGMSTEEKFRAAVKVIHSLPKDGPYQPSNGTKLKFYGLFKQATEGPCNAPRPAFWDMIGKYKWDAWNKLGNMTKEDAMMEYVEGLKEIVETMSFNGDVQDFLDSIGPFYEFVNLQGQKLNHIKAKIDELTSSSSNSSNNTSNANSSNTSASQSLAASPINSCPNSPLKNLQDSSQLSNGIQNETEDAPNKDEKAEVQVESRTATYETIVTKATVHPEQNHTPSYNNNTKSQYQQSGSENNDSKGDFDSNSVIPPPTPIHTYAQRNGFVKPSGRDAEIQETDEGGEEVMQLMPESPKTAASTCAASSCKEDLEKDMGDMGNSSCILIGNHVQVSNRVSVETLATTSGTESEKYYSGDSDPEIDERFTSYYTQETTASSNNDNARPGTSKTTLVHYGDNYDNNNSLKSHHDQQNHYPGAILTRAQIKSSMSSSKVRTNGGPFTRRSRERSSPKRNGGGDGLNQFVIPSPSTSPSSVMIQQSAELVLNSTVERLNRDVDHILARLRILETAYATSAEGRSSPPRDQGGRQRRRLFGELSRSSVAFIVMWPFAVHFLIKLISWWWRRRRALLMVRRLN